MTAANMPLLPAPKSGADTLRVSVVKSATLTVDALETIIEMAGFGCTYWAVSADWDTIGRTWTVHHRVDVDDPDTPLLHTTLTYQQIADAMARIYEGTTDVSRAVERDVRAELDDPSNGGGEIDSDDADSIVQVAVFGKVVYG